MGLAHKFRPSCSSNHFRAMCSFFAAGAATSLNVYGSMGTAYVFSRSAWRRGVLSGLKRRKVRFLSRAQPSMLLEGIDWPRPQRTWTPEIAV